MNGKEEKNSRMHVDTINYGIKYEYRWKIESKLYEK